jgi:3D (Asp-Asp-Asp) domain-containing protein
MTALGLVVAENAASKKERNVIANTSVIKITTTLVVTNYGLCHMTISESVLVENFFMHDTVTLSQIDTM